MSLESRIPKFPKFSKFPIFPRLPKFSDKQSIKDCPLSPQIICCQSGANLPPIKILGWMGHTIMYFPFSPMIEVAKERHYHNKLLGCHYSKYHRIRLRHTITTNVGKVADRLVYIVVDDTLYRLDPTTVHSHKC